MPSDLFAAAVGPKRKKRALIPMCCVKPGGNQSEAARLLGVSRVTVWKRIKKHGTRRETGDTGVAAMKRTSDSNVVGRHLLLASRISSWPAQEPTAGGAIVALTAQVRRGIAAGAKYRGNADFILLDIRTPQRVSPRAISPTPFFSITTTRPSRLACSASIETRPISSTAGPATAAAGPSSSFKHVGFRKVYHLERRHHRLAP
jgi:hypothetical protein